MGGRSRAREGHLRQRPRPPCRQDPRGVSPDFYRPTDVVNLWGDPTKARAKLGWNPNTTTFEELVKIMVDHDMAKVASEGAAAKVRMNLAEYLEKGIVK